MAKSQEALEMDKAAVVKERDELAARNSKLTLEKDTAEAEVGTVKDQLGKSSESSQQATLMLDGLKQ